MEQQVQVIGAGIAGLVAAISVAEAGVPVVVHEAARERGGRARSTDGPWRANYGPRAIYGDGDMARWLRSNKLMPATVRPPVTGVRVRSNGDLKRMPLSLILATLRLTRGAPASVSFEEWAGVRASAPVVGAAVGMAHLPTFHAEPGALSAAFVAERLRRVTVRASSIRYVSGGWSCLVAMLERRCAELDVTTRRSAPIGVLPEGPVIVATGRHAAEKLLGHALPGEGTRVAMLDVGLSTRSRRAPFAVVDLDQRTYLARYSEADRSLAPQDAELVQCSTPLHEGETADDGRLRLERALDLTLPDWRSRLAWRRDGVAVDRTGAVDAPGTTWSDRPAIDQGNGVLLAGDYVAAPGMLSEVSWASAMRAAELAVGAVRSRAALGGPAITAA